MRETRFRESTEKEGATQSLILWSSVSPVSLRRTVFHKINRSEARRRRGIDPQCNGQSHSAEYAKGATVCWPGQAKGVVSLARRYLLFNYSIGPRLVRESAPSINVPHFPKKQRDECNYSLYTSRCTQRTRSPVTSASTTPRVGCACVPRILRGRTRNEWWAIMVKGWCSAPFMRTSVERQYVR
jgi:hypothetical protein